MRTNTKNVGAKGNVEIWQGVLMLVFLGFVIVKGFFFLFACFLNIWNMW